jgi:DNA mismatch repair protein MutS
MYIGDIGVAVEAVADRNHLSIADELAGHGVGYKVHEDPFVPNFGMPGQGPLLKPGMVIAIEPMLNEGKGDIVVGNDVWFGYNCMIKSGVKIGDGAIIATNSFVVEPQLQALCTTWTTLKHSMKELVTRAFGRFVKQFEALHSELNTIIQCVMGMDVIYTKASIAKKYKYCKPVLVESEKSFVDAKQLRHALIEQFQTSELYVANDVSLGRESWLLYGTNAVGKTSLIRALGIAVIMAQAGLYVPCSTFSYKPYRTLFTRILGNDNLFKGLSTFAVEMSELRTILKMSNAHSLILGDELCSGTETQSAISIFVAGIQHLHLRKSSFLFATHLHEITEYEEITSLNTVCMKHMAVVYNKETGQLVYDRKLKDGPGDTMYGLEVCKSLQLPTDFMEAAYRIRSKYHSTSLLALKTSRYNVQKLVGRCEKCGGTGQEVHHIHYQKEAVEGFIQTQTSVFHKNHLANLMTVCERCHDDIHGFSV